jgi:hypothetical protein
MLANAFLKRGFMAAEPSSASLLTTFHQRFFGY